MSLYLAIFDGDEEIDSVEFGKYNDFDLFRTTICERLENNNYGSKYKTLQMHKDSEGEWSVVELNDLKNELSEILKLFSFMPPIQIEENWKIITIKQLGLEISSLDKCFFDVDGEPIFERLIGLINIAIDRKLPIIFQ